MENAKPMNILLIGVPGSGKGTQAKMLAEKYSLKHLESGAVLRQIVNGKTQFGKEVKEAMQKGFVPSEWIFKITREEFGKVDKSQGLVLDSFSKLLPEIENLYAIMSEYERNLDYIFLINLSDEEAMKRLTKRGVCGDCAEIIILKEVEEAVCSRCGGNVYMRKDDNLESIKRRIDDFRNKTSLVINYIKKNDRLIEINGEQSAEKVFEDIVRCIEK